MYSTPIQTQPLTWRKGDKLFHKGTQVRVRWEWLRVLTSWRHAGGDVFVDNHGATLNALLVAVDGSGLAWQPAEVTVGYLPQPGATAVMAYQPGDPTVWTITGKYGKDYEPPPNTVPRGWGGGDPRRWVPWLAQERELFDRGPRVVARVEAYTRLENTEEADTDIVRLDLTVDGSPQTWEGRLSYVNDKLRRSDEIVVALGPDGRIVALDTDERYLSDQGRCLVWTTSESPSTMINRDWLNGDIRRLAAQRGGGGLSEQQYAAQVQAKLADGIRRGAITEAMQADWFARAMQDPIAPPPQIDLGPYLRM